MEKANRKGALGGIRVLDLNRVLAGPFAGQILGDLGSEIVKVEHPGRGDDGRYYGLSTIKDKDGNRTKESSFYSSANRNKKSVTVNLAKLEGRELLCKLETPANHYEAPPMIGQHTDIILRERHGLDQAKIAELRQNGVL